MFKHIEKQKEGYCGPASLKKVFDELGIVKSQDGWANLSGTTVKEGVENPGMLKAIESVGKNGEIKSLLNFKELKEINDNGDFTILIWWSTIHNCGHYSPLSGIDLENQQITIADVAIGEEVTYSFEKFENLWFDFSKSSNRTPEDLELRSAIIISK